MKSIAIKDGDIDLALSRRMDFVRGKQKLLQDLRMWLSEPYGIGPTTPQFGSTLSDMIGTEDPELAAVQINAEVRRILGLYQSHQMERLRIAKARGTLGSWSRSEILQNVVDVASVVNLDKVRVVVKIRTLNENIEDLRFDVTITTGGVV